MKKKMQPIIPCLKLKKIYTRLSSPQHIEYSGYFYYEDDLICENCHAQQKLGMRCYICDRPLIKKLKNKIYISRGERHSSNNFTKVFNSFHTHIPLLKYDYIQSQVCVPSGVDMANFSMTPGGASPYNFTHYILGPEGMWFITKDCIYEENLYYWPIFVYYQCLKICMIQKNKDLGFDDNNTCVYNYKKYANNIDTNKLRDVLDNLKRNDIIKYDSLKKTLKSKNEEYLSKLDNKVSCFKLKFSYWDELTDSKFCLQNVH